MSVKPTEDPAVDSTLAEPSDASVPSQPEIDDPQAKARAELCKDLSSAGSIPQDVLNVLQGARFDVNDTARERLAPTPMFWSSSTQSAYVISVAVNWHVPLAAPPAVSIKGVFCPAYSNLDEEPTRHSLRSISKIHAAIHASSDGNNAAVSQLASDYWEGDRVLAGQAQSDQHWAREIWESRFGKLVVRLLESEIRQDMRESGLQATYADRICNVVSVESSQYEACMFTDAGKMDLEMFAHNHWPALTPWTGNPNGMRTSARLLGPASSSAAPLTAVWGSRIQSHSIREH